MTRLCNSTVSWNLNVIGCFIYYRVEHVAQAQITLLVLAFMIKWLINLASVHYLQSASPLSRLQNVLALGQSLRGNAQIFPSSLFL